MTGVAAWLTDAGNWQGPDGVLARLWEHVWLTVAALLLAVLLALPVALWSAHVGRGGALAASVGNAGRAVPTFALLVLLAVGPLGLGTASTLVALVVFGIPPILTNAHVAVREVDRDVVDAARGSGLSGWQTLRRVELPLAAPLVVTGVRLAGVQIVATATVAALVAGPGLGRIITAGFARQDQAQLVSGALLVAALALLVEAAFAVLERAVRPPSRSGDRGGSVTRV